MTQKFLTVSMVVYKPKRAFFSKVLENFNKHLLSYKNVKLYIIDNSCDKNIYQSIKQLIVTIFEDKTKIELIKSNENNGYTGGNNLILNKINSDYHLIVNPDVFLYSDTIFKAIDYMSNHSEVGLLSPDIYNEKSGREYLCRLPPTIFDIFFRRFHGKNLPKFIQRYLAKGEMCDRNYDEIIDDLQFSSGCFMFLRTDLLKQVGGFDEGYFMYFDDADLSKKILAAGYKVVYNPQVKIIHQWQRASRRNIRLMLIHFKSACRYWRKWGGIFFRD